MLDGNAAMKQAADNAMLLIFARVAQIVLVPIMLGLMSWTFGSVTGLQLEVAKAVTTSEANNKLLTRITDDLERRLIRIEDRQNKAAKE